MCGHRAGSGTSTSCTRHACLTAPWERVDPADEVGCPIAAEGWLARNGLLGEPLVHRYAALLGEVLGRKPKRRAAVVLTHDVDDAFGHLFGRRERWVRLRREPSLRRAASLARATLTRRADSDRFEAWTARPTFFFAARGVFDGGDPRDVAYDIGHPRVRETIRRLAGRGAEIGVHFSISSAGSAEEMRAERERLEESRPCRFAARGTTGGPSPPAAPMPRRESTSTSRSGSTTAPVPARDRGPVSPLPPQTERAADVWALPTVAMDAAVGEAGELAALWATVQAAGGLLVLDWHVHAANPRSGLPHRALVDFLREADRR